MESLAIRKIREYGAENGLKLPELAAACGVTYPMLVGWLHRGKFPKPKHVREVHERGIAAPGDWYIEADSSRAAA